MTKHKKSHRTVDLFELPMDHTSTLVFEYLAALDTPRSLAVWLLYDSGEHRQLVDIDIDPRQYNDASVFRSDYAATLFLSKSTFLKTGIDLKAKALEKFWKFEDQCRVTNQRVSPYCSNGLKPPSELHPLLPAICRRISKILDGYDGHRTFCAEEFFDSAGWGPGVSTSIKGEKTSAAHKFQCETGITRDLYDLVGLSLAEAYPLWDRERNLLESLTMEVGNHVVTVPKSSKTDRVIAIEPGMNLWFQKSIGSMIRRRLRWNNCDLDTQSKNRTYCAQAIKRGLATIDFSSASDSIARRTVELLIPSRWYHFMDACRSSYGIIDDKPHRWFKFSSMGNGFTFELESLIFYAIALEATIHCGLDRHDVTVFGDDVILPVPATSVFFEVCALLGFTINTEKSFVDGWFRESCGVHYFKNLDVTPLYMKQCIKDVRPLIRLSNAVRRLSHRWHQELACDRRFRPFVRLARRLAPPEFRKLRISEGYGDGGFIENFDVAAPSLARNGWEGFTVKNLTEVGKQYQSDGFGVLLSRVFCPSTLQVGNDIPLRGRTSIRVKPLLVRQWYNLGPWL